MNKLSRVFLVIIIILVIALGIMTSLYLYAIKGAKNNLNELLNEAQQLQNAEVRIQQLENNKLDSNNSIISE